LKAADSAMKVLVTAGSVAGAPEALRTMEQAGIEVVVRSVPPPFDESWLVEQVGDVDALVVAMEPVTAAILNAAPRLRVIARPGVGYDTVDLGAATLRGVIVTIASGTNHESVADFTFGLLLQATRAISTAAASVAGGGWQRVTGTESWGKTLAIVGLGNIGKAVARRARGFDMRVLAVTRNPDQEFGRQSGIEFVSLAEALGRADFVTLHAPLTAETANLIDARAIAAMKRGAYLINTSRGGLVDEQALADAVVSGHLAGAAVDVLREQGVGSRSALIGVPGIIVTPHMATFTLEASQRVAMSVAQSVVMTLRGERPPHVVNPSAFDHASRSRVILGSPT
jgi:D-3-phosphoglycerate dehydrogenase